MAWVEHSKEKAKQAAAVADKGLTLVDNVASIFNAIKWVVILIVLGIGLWIFSGIKDAVEGSSEAITQAVDDTKETIDNAKDATVDGTKVLIGGIKQGLESASKSETVQHISDVKEDLVNSEEYINAKEKAGTLITDKIGGFFKRKEEGCTSVGSSLNSCPKEKADAENE